MGIKEAFIRDKSSEARPTKIVTDHFDLDKHYDAIKLERGVELLKQAGVPGLLDELQEVLSPQYPDVKVPAEPQAQNGTEVDDQTSDGQIGYKLWANGTVSTGIGWDYRQDNKWQEGGFKYKAVMITGEPLTGDIIVSSLKNMEVVPRSVWDSTEGGTILEDALLDACQNPENWAWTPTPVHI